MLNNYFYDYFTLIKFELNFVNLVIASVNGQYDDDSTGDLGGLFGDTD